MSFLSIGDWTCVSPICINLFILFWKPRSFKTCVVLNWGLSWWLSNKKKKKKVCLQCGRCEFNPWVRKIPWRRKWQPTPEFFPAKFHGQRRLMGYIVHGVALICTYLSDWAFITLNWTVWIKFNSNEKITLNLRIESSKWLRLFSHSLTINVLSNIFNCCFLWLFLKVASSIIKMIDLNWYFYTFH